MTSLATEEYLKQLASTITPSIPFVNGISPLSSEDSIIFYGRGDISGRLDTANASEEDLRHLASACHPATFGMNQKDVLDESYRKAGKLDSANFALKFDVERSGLVETVRSDLLEERDDTRDIRAELYKLNVYGENSFFKPHKDTPRGDSMFGSLVIVFPTHHEGGSLILRHSGEEWTFDSAKILSECSQPSIAYIAFYSDVEHEVMPVTSGYRITVTYNLYFDNESESTSPSNPAGPRTLTTQKPAFHVALRELLANPPFLPEGGLLGFGLRHEYPLPEESERRWRRDYSGSEALQALLACLKGSDAVIKETCQALGLSVSLRVVYDMDTDDGDDIVVMCDNIESLNGECFGEEHICYALSRSYGGVYLKGAEYALPRDGKNVDVHWVIPLTERNEIEQPYIAYGNEPGLDHIYGHLCLLAEVKPFDLRKPITDGS